MFISIRSSIFACLALCATSVSPALAGQASGPSAPVTQAIMPQVPVPDVLDINGKPQLSGDTQTATPTTDTTPTVDATPAVAPSGDLSEMVAQLRSSDAGSHELECLATGVYFESKSAPLAGQLAVGQVIANRAERGGRFPSTYCGVLFQRGQFSFVHGHSLPSVPRTNKQWQTAVAIAKIVDQDLQE